MLTSQSEKPDYMPVHKIPTWISSVDVLHVIDEAAKENLELAVSGWAEPFWDLRIKMLKLIDEDYFEQS